jgi:hypothetical protein
MAERGSAQAKPAFGNSLPGGPAGAYRLCRIGENEPSERAQQWQDGALALPICRRNGLVGTTCSAFRPAQWSRIRTGSPLSPVFVPGKRDIALRDKPQKWPRDVK